MSGNTTYHTRPQKELLAYLKTASGRHHTANEIKEHFAQQKKPIGMATIYRHLERFEEEGIVQKYVLGPGDCACYAYVDAPQCSSHFHCRCEKCGRLIHLDCEELREIEAHLLEHHGFAWNTGKTVRNGAGLFMRGRAATAKNPF